MKRTFAILLALMTLSCNAPTEKPDTLQQPTNIIYMIGDGMGLAHVSMLKVENKFEPISFDRANNLALITTHSLNNRVTDSAAAGTALATANKTDNRTLGENPDGTPYVSMFKMGADNGYRTGVVVSCSFTHATPAAFYAHTESRYKTDEIASQLPDSGMDVVVAAGSEMLDKKLFGDTTLRTKMESLDYTVASTIDEVKACEDGKLLALLCEDKFPREPKRGDVIVEGLKQALTIMSNNTKESEKGFMLMMEGSQIDWAAHDNDPESLLAEMRDFNSAVGVAMDYADQNPGTLVVITADHETGGMSIVSNDADFTKSESGVSYEFGTHGHSGTMVPVYLYGTGSELINGIMDNTELSSKIMEIMGVK